MERYGFVYIWYDRKHRRYYVGSHWGTEDDGYICSSAWMIRTYKRRPEDFKRRILSIVENRKELNVVEHKWLQMIEENELGKKYYNLKNTRFGHWSQTDKYLNVREKISKRTKEAMQKPEVWEAFKEALKKRDNRSSDLEVREKRRQSMIGKNTGPRHPNTMAAVNQRQKCKYCDYVGTRMTLGRYHNEKCKHAIG